VEGLDESLDRLFHVGPLECIELGQQLLGTDVEPLVELVDLRLGVSALAGPVAFGATTLDQPPARLLGAFPADRLDQLGCARGADVESARILGGLASRVHCASSIGSWNAAHHPQLCVVPGKARISIRQRAPIDWIRWC